MVRDRIAGTVRKRADLESFLEGSQYEVFPHPLPGSEGKYCCSVTAPSSVKFLEDISRLGVEKLFDSFDLHFRAEKVELTDNAGSILYWTELPWREESIT